MKRNKIWMLLLAMTLLLASCAMARDESSSTDSGMVESAPMAMAPREEASKTFADEAEGGNSSTGGSDVNAAERIVIKNADLSIVVEDPTASMEVINQMAEEMGGYMVSTNTYKTTTHSGVEVPNANITVRVPAERLDEALARVKDLVEDPEVDILNENVSGQDVTSEVTDLESRLRNLQAAESQLLEIMDNAVNTEDVIDIFRELTDIRGQIEVLQGQIKYYRESASLSALSVNLQAKEALEPITIAGWQPGLQAQRALQALVEGGQGLVNALIWIVIFVLPLALVIGLPIYFIVKAIRKHSKNAKSKAEKKDADK
ncbi:MAG: hypothetical protein PWQ55_2457 [Chloroflexota bacterium]|nr:hypothetical protein [Chloroflexota bacterium]